MRRDRSLLRECSSSAQRRGAQLSYRKRRHYQYTPYRVQLKILRSDEAQFLGGSRDSMVLRGSGDGTGGEDTLPYSTRSLYVMKNHSNNKAINTTFPVVVFFHSGLQCTHKSHHRDTNLAYNPTIAAGLKCVLGFLDAVLHRVKQHFKSRSHELRATVSRSKSRSE